MPSTPPRGLPARMNLLEANHTKLKEFTERELGEHDAELLALRDRVQAGFLKLERKIGKNVQRIADLRKLFGRLRKAVADLAGSPDR